MRLVLTTLLVALLTSVAQAQPAKTPKVLVIGIDGLRPDALEAAKTPFLDELKKAGAWTDDAQILAARYRKNDTISGPGWSSILTGSGPTSTACRTTASAGRTLQPIPTSSGGSSKRGRRHGPLPS